MSTPTVFISYSHRDEAWKDRLVPHLEALRQAGVEMQVWHDRKIDGGDKWYPEIREAMSNAAAAILLISSDFLASGFCIQEEVPSLLKRQEELGMLLVPILPQCPWKAHRWLKDRQMLPRDAVKPDPWNKFEDDSKGRGPKDDLSDARKLIEQCGYWRRKEELEDAEEAAKNWD